MIGTENVGPATFHQLIRRFKTAHEALKRLPKIIRNVGRPHPLAIPSLEDAENLYAQYQRKKIHLLAYTEPSYPAVLRTLKDAPPLLSAVGNLDLLKKNLFSVVGARNASAAGRELAFTWSKRLSQEGMVIVSGLAEGIDTEAHKASLSKGTIAVLSHSIDHAYPPQNKELHTQICQQGLLLSEALLGVKPHASLFPRRNRLISGLSWGVLVVEAATKSGSLITAHYALDQGREVFAIPGHPSDPRAQGTNRLIQDGATLCLSPEDILDAKPKMHSVAEEHFAYTTPAFDDALIEKTRLKLQPLLTETPLTIEHLATLSNTSPALTKAALLELSLAGYADYTTNGKAFRRQEDNVQTATVA